MRRLALSLSVLAVGCATVPVYPARPGTSPGAPIADPTPAKVVVHLAATPEGLERAIDTLPLEGSGTFELRGERTYTWTRGPVGVKIFDNRLHLRSEIGVGVELPLVGTQKFKLEVLLTGEPVISTDWKARLQGAKVEVKSTDFRLRTADGFSGLIEVIRKQLESALEGYSFDLTPTVTQAYQRIALPVELPIGDAKGCVALKVTSIEAGPTVFAGGFEKDLAVVVAPSVTLPCAVAELPPLPPPLSNVATLPSGPFAVTVPIAADYGELARAMTMAFTDGKLFFSKDYPGLYLADPSVFASGDGQLILKLRLAGPIKTSVVNTELSGDIYFTGHPAVVDNELRIPDLEPTIDTSNFLLMLKSTLDANSIRDQARAALRLDIGERLTAVRTKLSSDFAFGGDLGCLRSDVSKIEVTGVFAHGNYLRVYVTVTAQAGVHLPCPATRPAAPTADR